MADPSAVRPAWARDSIAVRLDGVTSLDDLSQEWAWGGSTGEGARVAIVDSGIDADHPDLGDCVDVDAGVVIRTDDTGRATVEQERHGDGTGHGTAVASIVHALAPRASLTSVKVLGTGTPARAAAFVRGVEWAVEHGYDVVNVSLGTGRREWALAFYEVCDDAYFRNCLVVTAANNAPRPSFPSLFASVTSVAANMATDPFRFHYNPDPPTEFLARGIDVDVAWKGGARVRATGNSYAAPHITALAALIRAKHRDLRPFQVKTVLWATAANVQEAPRPAGRLSTTMTARRTSLGLRR